MPGNHPGGRCYACLWLQTRGRFQVALEDRRQEAYESLLQDACEDDEEDARAKDQKEALVSNQEDATGVVLHKLKCR